ncbi:NAD(P)/FAD-dependent oxidoreductase [Catenulispora yoronensis]|uniref:NAD(P)/FAD-dependent oxidoreductase n=1 Tax=Catenulispora yoronensis TaxID=450799 RepID=A0ABP5GYL9_9ACTN
MAENASDAAFDVAFDVAVIGAGPAGMAAATTAADHGLRVALIDAGRQLGGQYFRHPAPGLTAPWSAELHHGWAEFERLAARVETSPRVEVLFEHQVWAVEAVEAVGSVPAVAAVGSVEPVPAGAAVGSVESVPAGAAVGSAELAGAVASVGVAEPVSVAVGTAFKVLTDRGPIAATSVVLATGAYERVVPFPGWDLPGVFTAGGAQALLKGNLVLPGRRVVVAGTGPLLLPVAAGLAAAGANVLGLYDANRVRGYAKHPIPLLTNPAKLAEGLDFARRFLRHRVPLRSGYLVVEAQGTDLLEAVVLARPDGTGRRRVECDALAIGYGLAPQIDLGLTLGCEPRYLADGTVALRVDTDQRTTVPGFYAVGETAGVAGVQTSLAEGEIAGLAIAAQAGGGSRPADAVALRRRRDRQRAFADVIRLQHPVPPAWRAHLTGDTVVCRCEEVSAHAVTEAVAELGAADARTVKLLTRAGMGWCQGRVCGYAVACLAQRDPDVPPSAADLLAAAKRPLARPVPLGVLAEQDRRK